MATELDTTLAMRQRELALERRREAIRRESAISFYHPHAKQELFHGADFHYRYTRTGNRFGKSQMGAAEDVSFALGYRPFYAEGDPRRTVGIPKHPTKGLIVTTDWDKSKEVFTENEGTNLGKLFQYIPKSALGQPTRNHSGAIDRIPVKHISGGWSVIHLDTVKSFKQNPLGQESSVWDWIHIDEPIPQKMWGAIARGTIDRGGRAWFTCTPLTEPWIDEMFVPDLEAQSKDCETQSLADCWMMTGSTDDNPYNSKENIDRVMRQYSEEERETRRSGRPASYSGIIYKEFKWEEHVRKDAPPGWKDWFSPPESWTKRYAIDYHPRKPNAVLFVATSPQDIHYVYAELWTPSLLEDFVKEILALCAEPTVPALIDPLASTPNKVTDMTFMMELQNLGLPLMPATKDPYNGIIKGKQLLSERQKNGQPIIFFNRECRHTLAEISRKYMWDAETNKPLKQDDDMMENFYRLCLQGLSYIEPAGVNDYAPIRPGDLPDNVLDIREFDPFERKRKTDRSARYRTGNEPFADLTYGQTAR